MSNERPILIVDALNLFVRSWAASPQMSPMNGHQIGGVTLFLKTLARLSREIQPKSIYIAWESGGSPHRRAIFSEYKLNRRPEKLNRFYDQEDIPDTEENRKYQLLVLVKLMKHIPACQLYAADCEGDDVVAYLCEQHFKHNPKVIVSSDKDLYQLLNEQTKIYNLHKKIFVTAETAFEEFRITPQNFAVAKALCGDTGDNVPGLKGLGFKTIAKRFPQLGLDEVVLLQDIFSYSASHLDESSVYKKVVAQETDVKRNYRLVYLNGSMLTQSQQTRIDKVIETYVPRADKIGLMRELVKEGIRDLDLESFIYSFNCVDGIKYEAVK